MSLNVNYNSLYKNGIDTSILKDVSNEILRRAAQKSAKHLNVATTQQVSVAKPVELGIDLYQGKIDLSVQKQIAMNNALQFQFNQTTLNSIQYLNSQAAMNKNNDGKYIPVISQNMTEAEKVTETDSTHFVKIFTAATAKDKEGSNPFYNGELLAQPKKEESKNEKDSLKSIFA